MRDCERQFGVLNCRELGKNVCPMALNGALNNGDVIDHEGFKRALRSTTFPYVLRIYVVNSVDQLKDPNLQRLIPESYKQCAAKNSIAEDARVVLEEMLEDEVGDLETLTKISFGLPHSDNNVFSS